MKAPTKIVDGQALAKWADKNRVGEYVPYESLIEWIIGANNHVPHNYPLTINDISPFGENDVTMFHSRTEILLIDRKSFEAAMQGFNAKTQA